MEFPFDVRDVLPHQFNSIQNQDLTKLHHQSFQNPNDTTTSRWNNLCHIIDRMGKASAIAQGLREPITSYDQLRHQSHTLYLLTTLGNRNGDILDKEIGKERVDVVGMVKVGYKHLFLMDRLGQYHEREPLCVLDFYVHESKQRTGYGKMIFDHMLASQQVKAQHVAIDRPSNKFINFLSKHYSMLNPIHQGNRFTVFDAFFDQASTSSTNHGSKISNNDKRFVKLPADSKSYDPFGPVMKRIDQQNKSDFEDNRRENLRNIKERAEESMGPVKLFHQLQNKCEGNRKMDTNWNLFGVPGVF